MVIHYQGGGGVIIHHQGAGGGDNSFSGIWWGWLFIIKELME